MLLTSLSGRTFDGDGASPPPDMKVDVHPPHGVMIPMGKCSHMVGLKKSIHIMESKKKRCKRVFLSSTSAPFLPESPFLSPVQPFPSLVNLFLRRVNLFKPSHPFLA